MRQCFERARDSAPCVIFFDELDSLCPRRSAVEVDSTAFIYACSVNLFKRQADGCPLK